MKHNERIWRRGVIELASAWQRLRTATGATGDLSLSAQQGTQGVIVDPDGSSYVRSRRHLGPPTLPSGQEDHMAMTEAQLGIVALAAEEIREFYADSDEKMVALCLGVVLTATAVGLKELDAPAKDRAFASIHAMLQHEIDQERLKGNRRGDAIAAIETALHSILYTQ